MRTQITYTALSGIPLVEPGDDLVALLCKALDDAGLSLIDGDIVVLAQKIVSKAEGRYVDVDDVVPSAEALEYAEKTGKDARYLQVVLSQSNEVVRYRKDLVIVEHRLGYVMANAGIDESNVARDRKRRVLLLPRDPDGTSCELKARLDARLALTSAS